MGEEGNFVNELCNVKVDFETNCSENCRGNELIGDSLFESDNDVKWDKCDDKLICLFGQVLMVLLRGVNGKNGIRPIPPLVENGLSVDLFKLFCLVRDRGGFRRVSKEKLWGLIAEKFGFDYRLCASLKLIYFKYLDELDQWLNRITKDRVLSNGGNECGGNLGLLSLELDKRLKDFWTDKKELVPKDEIIEYDEICKRIDVSLKETSHFPDNDMGIEVNNGVVVGVVDDDDNLYDNREFIGKNIARDINQNCNYRKRKRDIIVEMLSWVNKVCKNPCDPSIGIIPGCSTWKENSCKDSWSVALLLRESRLHKRYTDSNHDQSSSRQKKHSKMHPSMYEDDIAPNRQTVEALRCSDRILASVKTSPSLVPCCKSYSVDHCKSESLSKDAPENSPKKQDLVNADTLATKITLDPPDQDHPVDVLVGPEFQAEVPIWLGVVNESDPKWLGTQVWSPDTPKGNPCPEFDQPGKGKAESCNCSPPNSVECYRFHIAERRMKLRRELGLFFYHWKFTSMGEEVSLSWSSGEDMIFKQMIRLNNLSIGKSFLPKKSRMQLVSYYYNVFQIKRRIYQNRVTPQNIDSDDDEADFGSVSESFGYQAVQVSGSKPMICHLNEQVTNFDYS